MSTEKIIRKVRGLLAKAESTTSGEAAALTAKAAELMERHAIDRGQLHTAGAIEESELNVGGTYKVAFRDLGVLLGQSMGFAVVYDREDGVIRWYGFGSDLDLAEILWTSLLVQLERAAEEHMDEFVRRYPRTDRDDRFYERRSFMSGWAVTVSIRIGETRRAVAAETDGRQQLVHEWAADHLQDRAVRPVIRRFTPEGYAEGRAAGTLADLGRALDETDVSEIGLPTVWDRAAET